MEARVIEKTTLKRLGREFIFTWSKIMGKTSTSKDIERKMVEVLLRVQNRIWGLIVTMGQRPGQLMSTTIIKS